MEGQAKIITLSKFNEAIELKILVSSLGEGEITEYDLSHISL